MDKPIIITRQRAIEVMEENLKRIKECSDSDTFLLLSYDLAAGTSLGRKRMSGKSGRQLMNESETFVLNKDEEEDSMSILSIYTEKQLDILNIVPIGKKHDMILIPKLE